MADNDLVRPSRDGDQFHYHWAARQCLGLLPGSNDLKAVTVEGPSSEESEDVIEQGVDLIDVGLYYGSETLIGARRVRYVQLKHSTRQVVEPWQAGGLSKTLRGFTKRYKKLLEQFSLAELKQKFRFEFTTNRPIDPRLEEALQDLTNAAKARHPSIEKTLLSYSALSGTQNSDFFSLFSFDADEPSLWAQRNLLSQDIANYLADADYDAPIQLKELVTRKAGSEYKQDPAIRRHDVLRALKVGELEILPAPSLIAQPQSVFAREQEKEILDLILQSADPVIIHADGGVGKSILARRLAASMPNGSESVLYDCFGDGLYRNALHYRHRHRDALVQISNELAARGLCHPLLPSSHADSKQYMQAFCSRLAQAIGILRADNAGANLCLIIDAADNADMAAEELNERAFVRDLIRASMPRGVRLVFTCRTHRRQRLNAPVDSTQLELRPFNESETAKHLRIHYPEATQAEVAEFAFLSSSNPRVQALALERRLPILEMLKQLGPEPTSVELAIGGLLQRAVDNLKDQAGIESNQIDLICQGLAILRPLVPVEVLAKISRTSESAVRSFALDLGRPLFVKGDSLHFLDEPAETWFRETFKPDADGLNQFLILLRPLASESSYVASTLPQILLAAGRMDELIDLALSEEGLPEAKPLERRDVELQRLTFALKACLEQGRHLSAAKLALKAAGENAGETRQTKLIQENTEIAARLLPPDRVNELVSRRTFESTWMGSHHAYDACLLSGTKEFTAEAASRLRMAMDWLYAWARSISDDGPREDVTNADRAEIALTTLRIQSPEAAAHFLRRWKFRHLALMSGKRIAQKLIDLGEYNDLDALAYAAGNDVWLLLGLASEVAQAGVNFPAQPLARLIRLLADRRVKLSESSGWDERWEVLYAVQSALSLAMRTLPTDTDTWAAIIQRYLPLSPPTLLSDSYGSERAPMIRAYALEAELRGGELTLIELAPAEVRQQLTKTESYGQSRETHVFKRDVGGLLPWIILSVKISCGRCPSDLAAHIAAAIQATKNAESSDYQRHSTIRQCAAIEWIRILRDSPAVSPKYITEFQTWVINRELPLWPDTLTTLCRLTARTETLTQLSFDFAFTAYEALEQLRDDAETRTDAYVRLARAILPISLSEADAYFSRAVEIASRIGDENLSRWSAMLDLASAASSVESRPQTAYRLSRVAELTYEYVARDKHFDWNRTVEALVDLCPSSALAILSRWRDRRFGDKARLLPAAIHHCVCRGHLPTVTPVALAGTDAQWNRLKNLQSTLDDPKSPFDARTVTQIAYRYLRIQSQDAGTWQALIERGREVDLELPDSQRLWVQSRAAPVIDHTKMSSAGSQPHASIVKSTPDWLHFFDGTDMADSSALRTLYADLKKYDAPYEFDEFFRMGIDRVGLRGIPAFIQAISGWVEFGVYELRYLLDAIPDTAVRMVSLSVGAELGLDSINTPHLPPKVYSGWDDLNADDDNLVNTIVDNHERYYFGVDIGPYWLAPLGRAFGVSEKAMEIRGRKALNDRFGGATGWSKDDARYNRKIFVNDETSHSHGSMPQTDDLRAYHAYHAMMIIASNLLEQRAVRHASEEKENEFDQWLHGYLLTRSDGGWLADRRDPPLVSLPPPKESYSDNEWYWRVTPDYLDQHLLTDEGLHVLWGYWDSGGRDNREVVSIRSARVSRNGANALLSALQTAPKLDTFSLPTANHDERLTIGDFSLKGWIVHSGNSLGLDEYDPWAAGIDYPAILPGAAVVEDIGLRMSADGRSWDAQAGGQLRSESWTQTLGYGRETEHVNGARLSGNTEFVQLFFRTYPMDCLVLSVSVKRIPSPSREKDSEFQTYPAPYVRYYLMDRDEIKHSL
ncbi:hypothetical protein BKM05_26670 [Pseudomonas avellanae]|nr:hypothetical protein BKM05_26670 [Pseudomonas avellanae]